MWKKMKGHGIVGWATAFRKLCFSTRAEANNTMVDYLSKHMPFTYPDRQADSFTQEEKINEAGKI